LLVRDIAVDGHDERRFADGVAMQREPAGDNDRRAVLTPLRELALPTAGAEEAGFDQAAISFKYRLQQFMHFPSGSFRFAPSVHALGAVIPGGDRSADIGD